MIQRIQTIYLLLSVACLVLIYFFPVTEIITSDRLYNYSIFIVNEIYAGNIIYIGKILGLSLTGLISVLLAGVNIFLYKNRKLQIKICFINILVLITLSVLLYFYSRYFSSNFNGTARFTVFSALPLVAIILNFMAYISIKKDEEIVKSIDRIR